MITYFVEHISSHIIWDFYVKQVPSTLDILFILFVINFSTTLQNIFQHFSSYIHSPNLLLSSQSFSKSTHTETQFYRDFRRISPALRAEFARGDGRIKRKEDDRRKNIQPNETLFVVNFSEETTKKEDLEMLFSKFGDLVRIDMKRNYAFVQFTSIEDATKAKNATNGGKLDQNVITVEYVAQKRGNDDRRRGDRDRRGGRGDYRGRRGYDRDRDYDRDYDRRRRYVQ